MGQKTNLLTLKSSFVNLNLQTQNPNFFLYGYFFAEVIQKIFNQKNVVVSNWTSNFVGNSLFINIHLYYKTVKLFFLKKKKFQKNQNLLHVQDTMLHNLFSKILFKNLLFLKTHFLIFSIKVLNKEFKLKKNKILLKFFFLKSQSFLNILFQRRFSFFFDFLKQIILLLQGFLNSSVFLQS